MTAAPAPGIVPASTRVMNLAHFLTEQARRRPEAPGFVWGRARLVLGRDRGACGGLRRGAADGLRPRQGRPAACAIGQLQPTFESMFACWRIGVVWVPANFRQTPAEVAGLAESAGARGFLHGAEFAAHAEAVARHVDFAIPIGPEGGEGADYDALVARHMGARAPAVAVGRDDPAWFFFTSGTTGRPRRRC